MQPEEKRLLTEEFGPTTSQVGPDLELVSSSGFNHEVSESFTQRIDGKDRAFLTPAEQQQEGLRRLAQEMEADDDDILFIGCSSTQESSLPHLNTHTFIMPTTHQGPQSGTHRFPDANMPCLHFNRNEASRHSAPAVLLKGEYRIGQLPSRPSRCSVCLSADSFAPSLQTSGSLRECTCHCGCD